MNLLRRFAPSCFAPLAFALAMVAALSIGAATAQDINAALQSIVKLSIRVPPDARSARTLGSERDGNGIVIDANGLIVTIGYLVIESDSILVTTVAGKSVPASVVGYDHDTGFGLLRASAALGVEAGSVGGPASTARSSTVGDPASRVKSWPVAAAPPKPMGARAAAVTSVATGGVGGSTSA